MPRCLADGLAVVVFRVSDKKDLIDVPGILFGNLKEFVFACRQVVGDRRFVKMTHVVKLMAMDHESVGFVSHHASGGAYLRGMRGVQVPVRFLGRCDHFHNAVELGLKLRIVLQLGEIGSAFHHFVQVRVDEAMGSVVLHFFSCQIIRRRLKMFDSRDGFFKGEGNQNLSLSN